MMLATVSPGIAAPSIVTVAVAGGPATLVTTIPMVFAHAPADTAVNRNPVCASGVARVNCVTCNPAALGNAMLTGCDGAGGEFCQLSCTRFERGFTTSST